MRTKLGHEARGENQGDPRALRADIYTISINRFIRGDPRALRADIYTISINRFIRWGPGH